MTSGTKLRLIWAYWDWLRPCYSTMQNFVCFAKKSVNRKPFLVSSDCALACAVALEANFCRWSTRKSFHRNHLLSTLRALGSVQFFLEHSHEWFLFTYQNFLNCHQTSKMPSRTFWRQPKSLHCFVRQQNPLFLGLLWQLSFIGADVISWIWPITVPLIDISGYTEKFACLRCEQGCKNKRLVMKSFQIFCKRQIPFLIVVWTGLYVKTWFVLLL